MRHGSGTDRNYSSKQTETNMTKDQLEDWQLALLVEARRFDDPTIVEANEAEALRDHRGLIDDAQQLDNAVVVEPEVKKSYEENEALREAAQGIDDWEVVESDRWEALQESCNAASDVFSEALKERHGLRDNVVESMELPAMVEQFSDEEDGKIKIESLNQHPETGGAGSDEGGDGSSGSEPNDDLSASDRNDAREKLERAAKMEDRTPEYADTLRQEAANIVGVDDADDIDMETL